MARMGQYIQMETCTINRSTVTVWKLTDNRHMTKRKQKNLIATVEQKSGSHDFWLNCSIWHQGPQAKLLSDATCNQALCLTRMNQYEGAPTPAGRWDIWCRQQNSHRIIWVTTAWPGLMNILEVMRNQAWKPALLIKQTCHAFWQTQWTKYE